MDKMHFTFSDTVAGYVTAAGQSAEDVRTQDERRPRVQVSLTDATYAEVIRNPASRTRTGRARCESMLAPGRFLFAYGIFYPEGGVTNSRPSSSCSSAAPRTTGASSRPTGGSTRSATWRSFTSTRSSPTG